MIENVSREIEEHQRTEAALRESEDRYRILARNVADGVSLIQDGKLIFVNDAFAVMYGYTDPNDLIGKKALDLICIEDQQILSRIHEDLLSNGFSEKTFRGKRISIDGREFWVEEFYNIIQWKSHIAILVTARDITRAKTKEIAIIKDAERLKETNIKLRSTLKDRYRFGDIIGKSLSMQKIYNVILDASSSDANIVIYGESGTGKELISKTIHDLSERNKMPLVPVNCGAIPENIFESEFFGHRKGAFTSAYNDRAGFLDLANGGTLLLDEIAELNPNMQVKLLRAIEGGGYTPVGDNKIRFSDFRIIATTNENLMDLVKIGKMREDFFYRIHIIPIYVPPLRERKEDIPMLIENFLKLYGKGKKIYEIPSWVIEVFRDYDWPGNVRELQSVLQRYLTVGKLDLGGAFQFLKNEHILPFGQFATKKNISNGEIFDLRSIVKKYERSIILMALSQAHWNRKKVSNMLNIPLRTLSRKIKDFG